MKGHTAAKHGAFKCSSKQSKLENHVKSIHGAHTHREYSCNKCPDTFKSENALQVHKKLYHYNKWFTCDECGSQCNKLNELEQHKAMFHNQFTHTTRKCVDTSGEDFADTDTTASLSMRIFNKPNATIVTKYLCLITN